MTDGQVKHLEFIQAAINRMAQNSFTMKGWAVTLVSAILVVAHEIAGWQYLLVALLPAFVFWGFDAYYLRRERLFRAHYDAVRMQPNSEWEKDQFSLDTSKYESKYSWIRACGAVSILWLYAPMLMMIVGVTLYAAFCQH